MKVKKKSKTFKPLSPEERQYASRCPNCGHKQLYITRYTPLYLLDESHGMVCEKCGWDIWGDDFFDNIDKRK